VWVLLCGVLDAAQQATAVATVKAGAVTDIEVTSFGSGYMTEPAVTITGGGGSGAAGRAFLSGDQVVRVSILAPGRGYSNAPTVILGAPLSPPKLIMEPDRTLKIRGPAGVLARLEWSAEIAGPWMAWSEVMVGADGSAQLDLGTEGDRRFYRPAPGPKPIGPEGYVWIGPGTFLMGSPAHENPPKNEVPHMVTLTRGFWLLDHEVTQREFESVMGTNPSKFQGDLDRPVESVSWEDAVLYCQRLTRRERAAGRITGHQAYRLPTEAEWEHAARAGTTGARYGELDAVAWHSETSGGESQRVKQKLPNEWGLYDMLGNVWEWCSDWYDWYPSESVTDPTGPKFGTFHIFRGGSYNFNANYQRAACRRFGVGEGFGSHYVGFRTAFSSLR